MAIFAFDRSTTITANNVTPTFSPVITLENTTGLNSKSYLIPRETHMLLQLSLHSQYLNKKCTQELGDALFKSTNL